MTAVTPEPRASRPGPAAVVGLLIGVAALLWVVWPTVVGLSERWASDPRYSHGYLVPVFSLYLLYRRRAILAAAPGRPSWVGLPVLLAGLGVRLAGTLLYVEWLSAIALLPCLAGLLLVAGGRTWLRWGWPAVAFLVFMVPLPYRLETALAFPLQAVATRASTYALQTFGFVAVSEGHTIRMGDVRLGVVEACSGLSMLIIFFALSTAMAIVVRRPWYERLLVVVSAVPVAVAVNVIRIVATGILHKTVGSEVADYVFHDLAGWLMMPLALAMLWVELRLVQWVIIDPRDRPAPAPVGLPGLPLPAPFARPA